MSEFKPKSWAAPVEDLVKEYDDFANVTPEAPPTEPDDFSKSMVRRGLLNPETGAMSNNSKQGKILQGNIQGYSPKGKLNYTRIFNHG